MSVWKPLFCVAHTRVFDFIQCGGRTVRIIFPVNVTGTAVKIHFSNEYGTEAVELSGSTIAMSDENGRIQSETMSELLFKKKQCIILEKGQEAVSDEVPMRLVPGKWLAVSMYFPQEVSPRSGNCTKGYSIRSIPGDYRNSEIFEMDNHYEDEGKVFDFLPLFRMAEIYTHREDLNVVGVFGDSISTGIGASWFNRLRNELRGKYPDQVTFVNAGIPGNRLLKDSPKSLRHVLGTAGIYRFEKDILSLRAVTHCIFALGINDLLFSDTPLDPSPLPEVEEFQNAYGRILKAAKQNGIKTIFMPILPCGDKERFTQKKEMLRREINEFLQKSGMFDISIDCDGKMLDACGLGMRQEYVLSDGTHLSEAGADAVYRCIKKEI